MALKTRYVRFADALAKRGARQNAGPHDLCGVRLDSLDRRSY
jgi:hypothetical protein